MSDYKRLVSYIYSYPGGVRDKNVGFVKAEVRNGQLKLAISLNGVYTDVPQTYSVYIMVDKDEDVEGRFSLVKIGSTIINKGIGNYNDLLNPNNINGSMYTFSDVEGIALANPERKYYMLFSMWKDTEVNPAAVNFVPEGYKKGDKIDSDNVTKKTKDSSADSNIETDKEINTELDSVFGTEPDLKSDPEPALEPDLDLEPNLEPALEPDLDLEPDTEPDLELESDLDLEADTEQDMVTKTDIIPDSKNAKRNKTNYDDSDSIINALKDGESEIYPDDLDEDAEITFERNYKQRLINKNENTVQSMSFNRGSNRCQNRYECYANSNQVANSYYRTRNNAANKRSESERCIVNVPPPFRNQTVNKQASNQQQPDRTTKCANANMSRSNKYSESKKEHVLEAQSVNNTVELNNFTAFENIFVNADIIDAFDDDYFYDCIEVTPDQIRVLPVDNESIINNSFLIHGYYNYKHILFGRVRENDNSSRYFIGVPGMYCNRERFMASMFGFNSFKKSHRSDYTNPYFGYWFQEI